MDEESAANGSLMRLAPVAIRWSHDPPAVVEQAAASSRTTHAARRPVDACKLLAAMTAALIRGKPAAEVFDPGFWSQGELHEAVAAVARGSWRGKEPQVIRGKGHCVAALEAAIWAVAGARDFRDAILRATNLGDDADTTAAIERLSHPIPNEGVTSPEHYDRIVADIERTLATGRKVFVHCVGGRGRTGTVIGIWHVHRGHSADAALEQIAAAREGTRKQDLPSPENPAQIEAIRRLRWRRHFWVRRV